MPAQQDPRHETHDEHHHYDDRDGEMPSFSGSAPSRHGPTYTYSQRDLEILHEVISLAGVGPGPPSSAAIWSAYDVVLTARGLDPVQQNHHLYRFIMRLQGAPGRDMQEKFWYQVREMGMLDDESRYDEPSEAVTEEYREKIRAMEEEEQGMDVGGEKGGYGDGFGEGGAEGRYQDTSGEEVRSRRTRPEARGSTTDNSLRAAPAVDREWQDRRIPDRQRATNNSWRGAHGGNDEPELSGLGLYNPDDIAADYYRVVQRNFIRAYFQHWRQAVVQRQEARYFEAAQRAIEDHMLRKYLIEWANRAGGRKQITDEARARLLAKRYFAAWKGVMEGNEQQIRQFQLAVPFHNWREATEARMEDTRKAQRHYNEGLVRAVYHVWYRRHLETKAESMRKQTILQGTFRGWRERADRVLKMKARAETFYRIITLQNCYVVWLDRTEKTVDDAVMAVQASNYRIATKAFQNWRLRTRVEPVKQAFQTITADRLLHDIFILWRKRAKNQIAAEELYKQNLIKRIFRHWALSYRQHVFQDYYCERLQRRVFNHWQQQQRATLLRRTIEYRNARNILHLFTTNLHQRSVRLRTSLQVFTVNKNRNLALATLQQWRHRLANLSTLSNTAESHRRQSLLKAHFYPWHSLTLDYTQDRVLVATAFRNFFAMQYAFHQLRTSSKNHKKTRLKAAFHTISRLRLSNLASRAFTHWRTRTHTITTVLQDRADAVIHGRNRSIVSSCLATWREKLRYHVTLIHDYQSAYRDRVLRAALKTWGSHLQELRRLDELAEQRRRESDQAAAANMVRVWRQKYWKLEPNWKLAEREAQRNQINLLRRKLEQWRDKARRARGLVSSPDDELEAGMDELQLSPRRRQQRSNALSMSIAMTPLVHRAGTPSGWRTSSQQQQQQQSRSSQPPATLPHINLPLSVQPPMTPLGSPVKRRLFARSTLGRFVTLNEDSGEWDPPMGASAAPGIPATPPTAGRTAAVPATTTVTAASRSQSQLDFRRTPDLGQRRVREYVQQQQRRSTGGRRGHGIVEEDEDGGYEEYEDEDEDDGTLVGTMRTGSKRSANSGFVGRGLAL